jgi:hypothetical protein
MPVSYEIDESKGLIRTQCAGQITLAEVLEHFRALVSDPRCPRRLDVFLDLCQVTSIPRSVDLRDVADEIRQIRDMVHFGACAVLACSDAIFGMARMFEVFAEESFEQTRVFRVREQADAWLASVCSGDQRTT